MMQPYPPKGTLNPAAMPLAKGRGEADPPTVTISVCSHMIKALNLKDGDVRNLAIDLSGEPWVFRYARIALDEECDCEEEA